MNAFSSPGTGQPGEIEPLSRASERVAAKERVPARTLVEHRESVQGLELLGKVFDSFAHHTREFVAVLDGEKFLGAVSRGQLGFALSTRFGAALHAREPIQDSLLPDHLCVGEETPLVTLLALALAKRGPAFHHDVAVVGADQNFLGFISVQTLVHLQSELMTEKRRLVESANQELSQEVLERTRAERALQQAQKIAHVGSWERDVVHQTVVWSEEQFGLYGVKPGEFTPDYNSFLTLIHGEDQAMVAYWINTVLATKKPSELEYRIVRPNGEVRVLHSRSNVILDDSGKVLRTVGTSQDITERKQAECELAQTHKRLLEVSRQAGMAEIATGVLHNVGNVLNSVNVASNCVRDGLRKSKAPNLSKVVTLLREHEADLGAFFTHDPKGQQLPSYLAQLAGHLAGEQATALTELADLQRNIEHIKEIVSMQQSFANVSGITETLAASDLIEDALKMNSTSLLRHDIEVIKEYGRGPLFSVEKHKVLQILVNLIRNAKHACDDSGRVDKRLTICVTHGGGRVRISVMDNGIGIPPENLTRIFAHGFTTKKDGHGFGLHSGALAAREMGGDLTAHSDGPGCGSRFTLELLASANSNNLCLAK